MPGRDDVSQIHQALPTTLDQDALVPGDVPRGHFGGNSGDDGCVTLKHTPAARGRHRLEVVSQVAGPVRWGGGGGDPARVVPQGGGGIGKRRGGGGGGG